METVQMTGLSPGSRAEEGRWVAALVRRGDPKASDQGDAGEEERERPRVGAGRERPFHGPYPIP